MSKHLSFIAFMVFIVIPSLVLWLPEARANMRRALGRDKR